MARKALRLENRQVSRSFYFRSLKSRVFYEMASDKEFIALMLWTRLLKTGYLADVKALANSVASSYFRQERGTLQSQMRKTEE